MPPCAPAWRCGFRPECKGHKQGGGASAGTSGGAAAATQAPGAASGAAAGKTAAVAGASGAATAPAAPIPPLPADPGGKKGAHIWSMRMGGNKAESGRGVAVNSKGHVWVTGLFRDKVDFGDKKPLTAQRVNGFLARLSPAGALEWVRPLSCPGDTIAAAVATTDKDGGVVAGSFSGQMTVGDGTGTLKAEGADNLFVARFDASGRRLWATHVGGLDEDGANAVAVAPDGAIAVTGIFGADVQVGKQELTGGGDTDILLVMLGPDGTVRWARGWGAMGPDEGRALAFDQAGNLYALVEFSREVNFGTGPLKSVGNRDVALVKLDATGKTLWARAFGGHLDELPMAVSVNPSGSPVIIGSFTDAIDFGDGPMRSMGRDDVFVAKLSPQGKTLWSRRLGDTDEDIGAALATDQYGNVYAGGWFWKQLDLAGKVRKSHGKKDMFLAALSPSGDPLWGTTFGGVEDDYTRGLAVDKTAIYMTGTFHKSVNLGGKDLAAAAAPKALLPMGDVFVAKLAR